MPVDNVINAVVASELQTTLQRMRGDTTARVGAGDVKLSLVSRDDVGKLQAAPRAAGVQKVPLLSAHAPITSLVLHEGGIDRVIWVHLVGAGADNPRVGPFRGLLVRGTPSLAVDSGVGARAIVCFPQQVLAACGL